MQPSTQGSRMARSVASTCLLRTCFHSGRQGSTAPQQASDQQSTLKYYIRTTKYVVNQSIIYHYYIIYIPYYRLNSLLQSSMSSQSAPHACHLELIECDSIDRKVRAAYLLPSAALIAAQSPTPLVQKRLRGKRPGTAKRLPRIAWRPWHAPKPAVIEIMRRSLAPTQWPAKIIQVSQVSEKRNS